MGYEAIYVTVIAIFIIHVLIYRKNSFIGSLAYLILSVLILQPLETAGVGQGIGVLMIGVTSINMIYELIFPKGKSIFKKK